MTLNGSNECDECVSKLKSYMALTLLFFFFFFNSKLFKKLAFDEYRL